MAKNYFGSNSAKKLIGLVKKADQDLEKSLQAEIAAAEESAQEAAEATAAAALSGAKQELTKKITDDIAAAKSELEGAITEATSDMATKTETNASLALKLDKTDVVNNLTTAADNTGKALDASQGKILDDKISAAGQKAASDLSTAKGELTAEIEKRVTTETFNAEKTTLEGKINTAKTEAIAAAAEAAGSALEDAKSELEDSIDEKVEEATKDLATKTELTNGLAAKLDSSKVGVANGVAQLDGSGLVPSDQLPSYVDDVVEGYLHTDGKFYEDAAHTADKEINGEKGKIYVDLATNMSYRYSGSTFILITSADMVEMDEAAVEQLWNSVVLTGSDGGEDDDEDDDNT